EIGQFEISPIVEPGAFRPLTGGQALPRRSIEFLRNRLGRAENRWLADPGMELLGGIDPEYVALARPAQGHLNLAHTVDAVRRHPGKRHLSPNGALNHADRKPRFGGKFDRFRHMRAGTPCGVVRPTLGQVERTVDEGMAVT